MDLLKFLYWVGSALLVLFYASVFWIMLNPDVSPQFQAFYIDGTTDKGLQAQANDQSFFAAREDKALKGTELERAFYKNWSDAKPWGAWSLGNSSSLRLPCDWIGRADAIELTLFHIQNGEQIRIKTTTGRTIGTQKLSKKDVTMRILTRDLDACQNGQQVLILRTRSYRPSDLSPNSEDKRRLGIGLTGIHLITSSD